MGLEGASGLNAAPPGSSQGNRQELGRISRDLSQVSGFPWGTAVGDAAIVLIIRGKYDLRCEKEAAQRFPDWVENVVRVTTSYHGHRGTRRPWVACMEFSGS